MKKFILLSIICVYCFTSYGVTWTISASNSVLLFTPDSISITSGDTVAFALASIHNAVEVSQATWIANGNTPLPGGFSVPFGGGSVLPAQLPVGTHYYVCQPHASSVMKGRIFVNPCSVSLALKFFIQGYYTGGGMMRKVLFNELVDPNPSSTHVDTFVVELRSAISPSTIVASTKAVLQTNGALTCTFQCSVIGSSYYVTVKHRNAIQTWSASPIAFSSQSVSYDFSTAANKAYGDNMIDVFTENTWSFYNGDINQDGNIDLIDFPPLDLDINNGVFGYYKTDLNGDGNVDLIDFPTLDLNINMGIFSRHP